jgi:hypothetical protein
MRLRTCLVILTLWTVSTAAISPAGVADNDNGNAELAPFDDAITGVDFFGNEISAAVARYKLDPSGVVYEEHSPQTELPRLGSPRS